MTHDQFIASAELWWQKTYISGDSRLQDFLIKAKQSIKVSDSEKITITYIKKK
jgi:hypothetical protein